MRLVAVKEFIFKIFLEESTTRALLALAVPGVILVRYPALVAFNVDAPIAIVVVPILLIPVIFNELSTINVFPAAAYPIAFGFTTFNTAFRSPLPVTENVPLTVRFVAFIDDNTFTEPEFEPIVRLPLDAIKISEYAVDDVPYRNLKHEPLALATSNCVVGLEVLIPTLAYLSIYRELTVPVFTTSELCPESLSNIRFVVGVFTLVLDIGTNGFPDKGSVFEDIGIYYT